MLNTFLRVLAILRFTAMAVWIACAASTRPAPVRSPAKARASEPSQTHVMYASRFFRQESQAEHGVPDEMAIILIVSAVVHTSALRGKAGAWNMVVGTRYRRPGARV